MGDGAMCELLVDDHSELRHLSGAEDLFSILETWEECVNGAGGGGGSSAAAMPAYSQSSTGGSESAGAVEGARPTANSRRRAGDEENGVGRGAPMRKKQKGSSTAAAQDAAADEGAAKMSHIAVERNRRKQMNEHLAVLRSLMPCFYIKRGDQASIIGGVVDYIKELQQVLQSLEAKKQRKAYTDQVLSPRPPLPPLKSTPPISPRPSVLISPRTPPPGPGSPYKVRMQPPLPLPLSPPGSAYASPARTPTREPSPASSSSYLPSLDKIAAELCAYAAGTSNKPQRPALLPATGGGGVVPVLLPDVRVEFSGANLVVKTVSHRAPGQAVKVIAALEGRSLEILDAKISTVDDTAVNSFTIKIGIECELSAEELVQEIQQAFS